jgi:hypothetical protein
MTKRKGLVYRVQLLNGKFDHVVTKQAAVIRAIELLGPPTPLDLTARDLEQHWGVKLIKVSPSVARSVGL